VDHFALGVLFITERDDRGFTTTRVGTEFRVDVSLDGRGDGLGLREVEKIFSSSVSLRFARLWMKKITRKKISSKSHRNRIETESNRHAG